MINLTPPLELSSNVRNGYDENQISSSDGPSRLLRLLLLGLFRDCFHHKEGKGIQLFAAYP